MKPSTRKTLVISAVIIIPLFLPIPPLARFGIPALIIVYLLYTGIGTIRYFAGVRAGINRDHDKAVKYILKASRSKLSIERGAIAAMLLLKYDKLDEAEQLFASLDQMKKSPSQQKYLRSYQALLPWQKGDREEAVLLLENLLNNDGHYRTTHVYSTLGYFLLHCGKPERALELNLEAVDYDPTPDILDNLAAAYIATGDWENAESICNKVTDSNPGFSEAWYHAGIIAEHFGDFETAYSQYKRARNSIFSNLSLLKKGMVDEKIEEMRLKLEKQSLLTDSNVFD
ncbi:MAG: tetratricopeptide repeat protein [Spirochaetia bacterium]|nr:tetratricopeptide repeat protein [Spirochaetia bacterium]